MGFYAQKYGRNTQVISCGGHQIGQIIIVVELEAIACRLPLSEVFDKVESDESERQIYMAAARLLPR